MGALKDSMKFNSKLFKFSLIAGLFLGGGTYLLILMKPSKTREDQSIENKQNQQGYFKRLGKCIHWHASNYFTK